MQRGPQSLLVVPTLVERLEDVDELRLGEAVEVGRHGVEFPDVILLLIRVDGTVRNAELSGPIGEAFVLRCEPSGKGDDAIPERAIPAGTRNGKWVDDKVGQVGLHESPRIPVERNGTQ